MVEGDAGEPVGGAGGGEVDAQRANGHVGVGAVGGVHGEQLGSPASGWRPRDWHQAA